MTSNILPKRKLQRPTGKIVFRPFMYFTPCTLFRMQGRDHDSKIKQRAFIFCQTLGRKVKKMVFSFKISQWIHSYKVPPFSIGISTQGHTIGSCAIRYSAGEHLTNWHLSFWRATFALHTPAPLELHIVEHFLHRLAPSSSSCTHCNAWLFSYAESEPDPIPSHSLRQL